MKLRRMSCRIWWSAWLTKIMANPVTILTVGGRHDPELAPAIGRYEARLAATRPLRWLTVAYSARSGDEARRDESRRLLQKIKADDYVILCDERGSQLSSEAFAAKISGILPPKRLVIVVGGAYGVDDSLRQRADFIWALSALVFPHQLMRLILAEQLYRAQTISTNHPYHHQ